MRFASLSPLLLTLSCGAGGEDPGSGPERVALFDAPAPSDALTPVPVLEIPADAPLVAFLGDSIAAGLHLAEHQAFPAVLQQRLAGEQPFRLINASESGRTTAGGLATLEWVLPADPDVVVLQLGGNDGLRGIALEEVERNLRAMIEAARGSGAEVLLLGVRIPPNYGEYGAAFDALYPALAEEYGLAFAPYFMEGVGGVPEMNLADGLHPTAEGQERLAERVAPDLSAALARRVGSQ